MGGILFTGYLFYYNFSSLFKDRIQVEISRYLDICCYLTNSFEYECSLHNELILLKDTSY